MKRFSLFAAGLVALLHAVPVAGQDAAAFRSKVKPFIESHCIDCHGPDVQKAALRLDALGSDLADDASFAKWVRVHDKIVAGEMPPKDGGPLPKAEVESFTKWLGGQLHAASLARQQAEGRVPLRRLNGTQYENTIRELVGTLVRVKELLPDEKSVAGFDNVSSALDFSATHLLLYQEAADKAIRSAVPQHPPIPFRERRTGKEFSERGPNFKQTLDRSCKLEGESLIVYSKLPRYGLCATSHLSGAGVYRIRMSVAAVGAEKKPIPVGFFILESTGRDDPVLFDCRDIPHGESQVVELEVELGRRQAFVVNLLTSWDIRDFKRPIAEYTGPGLKIDWLEIEGPIGTFPPASYEKLFAGVPLKARSVAKAEREGGRVPTNIAGRRTPDNGSTIRWSRPLPIRRPMPSG